MSRNSKEKVVLIIVDGFGIGPEDKGNAINQANTPAWDELKSIYPWIPVKASGIDVGLPKDIMGNSEVGHLTIGAGRIIFQSLERINQSIENNNLADKKPVKMIVDHLEKTNGSLHLMGLLSDGMVHSSQDHLHTLIDIFEDTVPRVWIHGFTDGRDTPTDSSPKYISRLKEHIANSPNVALSTIVGRYYAMDRDNKWDRTKIAYDALIKRKGAVSEDSIATISERYQEGETDEFLKPIILEEDGNVKDGDAILFFNFRPDRARQLTQAFNYDVPFDTIEFENISYVTMTQYDDDWDLPVLFEPKKIEDTLAEIISRNKMKQVHIAETEKYAHVTYFLNGGREDPFELEDRILVPSLKIDTYDLQPEMSTPGITEKSVQAIGTRAYDFIAINIACPDMVGHTGNLSATIEAVEAMDKAFADIYQACQEHGYTLLITADHGNAEKMLHEGEIHTAHTTNKVPFLISNNEYKLKDCGGLKDVTPTILDLLGLQKSDKITGSSIIIK